MADARPNATHTKGEGFRVIEVTSQAPPVLGLAADGSRKRRVLLNIADAPALALVWVGNDASMVNGRRLPVLRTTFCELVIEPQEELWFQAGIVVGLVPIAMRVELLEEGAR